ncbi:hypothetical protein AMTR_s00001p00272980 [Amborella trichopoda]|uniref:Uncharacterized protein n=1 Tax=Amborella trichopoda TaxID=13333 RepID=W1NN39_AMBTC|nr:hypothetical protein AMTR_s00001p00272980 [Amborella trichopoda]
MNKDNVVMEYLSPRDKTRSLFDDIHSIFEWVKGCAEGRPIQNLNSLIGSGTNSAPSIRLRRGRKALVTEELRTPGRGGHAGEKGLSIPGTSSSPPLAKGVREKVSIASTPPPATPSSAPRVKLEATVARPEVSGSTTFDLSGEPTRAHSIVEVAMPPTASPIGSPTRPSLSPGDFLCAFIEEANIEAIEEVSNAGVTNSEAPTPTISKMELRVKPHLEILSSELVGSHH